MGNLKLIHGCQETELNDLKGDIGNSENALLSMEAEKTES